MCCKVVQLITYILRSLIVRMNTFRVLILVSVIILAYTVRNNGDDLFTGNYEISSDPNATDFDAYMTELGIADWIQGYIKQIKQIEFHKVNETMYNTTIYTVIGALDTNLPVDQVVDDIFVDFRDYKRQLKILDKNTATLSMTFGNVTGLCQYTFSEAGFVANCTTIPKGIKCTKTFKRVSHQFDRGLSGGF